MTRTYCQLLCKLVLSTILFDTLGQCTVFHNVCSRLWKQRLVHWVAYSKTIVILHYLSTLTQYPVKYVCCVIDANNFTSPIVLLQTKGKGSTKFGKYFTLKTQIMTKLVRHMSWYIYIYIYICNVLWLTTWTECNDWIGQVYMQ